ncbi:MAG: acetyl-CoA hydrolase [Actinomycetota bacterium]|nr:acetyl-CoA hydrolase [Actinomycetota bacterium]
MAPVNAAPATIVVMADGPDGPLPDPMSLPAIEALPSPEIVLGWIVRDPGWLDCGHRVTTLMAGVGSKDAVSAGAVRSVPTRLSAIPRLLAGRLRPTVAVVSAVHDRSGFRFAPSVGWAPEAARWADEVIVEVHPLAGGLRTGDLHTPVVEGNVVAVIDRHDPPDPPPAPRSGPVERRIGELVATLVPDDATIQWGPGKIGAAAVNALIKPVAVRSGLVTDELVALSRRGLLAAPAEAAYLWGSGELHALLAEDQLRMRPVSYIHDLTLLSALERLVTINTALEVGLDGAANVEGSALGPVSGPGGHPDFCAGASRSPGGLSIIALGSCSAGRSAIVERPKVVSAPRFDVDVVVTEHGVADLRGAEPAERAERMVAIADPAHRPELVEVARAWRRSLSRPA